MEIIIVTLLKNWPKDCPPKPGTSSINYTIPFTCYLKNPVEPSDFMHCYHPGTENRFSYTVCGSQVLLNMWTRPVEHLLRCIEHGRLNEYYILSL